MGRRFLGEGHELHMRWRYLDEGHKLLMGLRYLDEGHELLMRLRYLDEGHELLMGLRYLDEGHELLMGHMAVLHIYLHGQQQREEELVFLIEAPAGNPPDLVRQVLDDVRDAVTGDRTLIRSEGLTRRREWYRITRRMKR